MQYQTRRNAEVTGWQKTCWGGAADQCSDEGEGGVERSFRSQSGDAVLKKRLLKVTYRPPLIPEPVTRFERQVWWQDKSKVLIECGHSKFRAMERYPDVACGQCSGC